MNETTNITQLKATCENHDACMKMVQLILDGEATPEQVAHFKAHNLKDCMPCIESYKLGQQIRASLQNNVEKKSCPQMLSDKIKLKIGIFTSILIIAQCFLICAYFK